MLTTAPQLRMVKTLRAEQDSTVMVCWVLEEAEKVRGYRWKEAEREGDTSGITAGPNPARLEGCCYCKTQKELLLHISDM